MMASMSLETFFQKNFEVLWLIRNISRQAKYLKIQK